MEEVMVYVDQLGIEDLPLSEMESKLKELKGARWIEINPVRTEEELRLEVEALKKDAAAMEQAARERLGLVKEDEVIYRLPE